MVKFIKALLFFSVLALMPLSAQQVTIKASTDTSKYRVGDYITYKLSFTYDKNIQINYPSVKDTIKNLEFIKEDLPVKHESSVKVMETRSYIFLNTIRALLKYHLTIFPISPARNKIL